jgi:hypothetical protein
MPPPTAVQTQAERDFFRQCYKGAFVGHFEQLAGYWNWCVSDRMFRGTHVSHGPEAILPKTTEALRSYAQQLDRHERQMSGRSEAGRVSSYSNGGAGRESEEDRQARYDMMSSLGDIGGATFPQQPPVVAPLGRTVTQNVGMLALLPPPVPDLASSLGMSIHSLYQGRRAPRYCQQCHKPMQGHPRGRCESDGQG